MGRKVFRVVAKDADHPEERLFPLSALTPPPPIGSSDLSLSLPRDVKNRHQTIGTAAESSPGGADLHFTRPRSALGSARPGSCLALFRNWNLDAVVVPELVSIGALSLEDGRTVSAMIKEEDPAIISAFRVAAASVTAAATTITAASATTAAADVCTTAGGDIDFKWHSEKAFATATRGDCGVGKGAGRGGSQGDGAEGLGTVGAWMSSHVRDRLVYMIEVVLGELRRRKGAADRSTYDIGGRVDNYGGNVYAREPGNERGHEGSFFGDGYTGYRASAHVVVPEMFQADVIALADVALVTGKVSIFVLYVFLRLFISCYRCRKGSQRFNSPRDGCSCHYMCIFFLTCVCIRGYLAG